VNTPADEKTAPRGPSMPTPVTVAIVVVVVAFAAVTIVARVSLQETTHTANRYTVQAAIDGCGTGWRHPHSGLQRLSLVNTSTVGMEVYLQRIDDENKPVYLDVENLGAGATIAAQTTIAAGRYRFVCLPADTDPLYGSAVTVTGSKRVSGATPAIAPVTRNDLIPAAKAYEDWVESRMPDLLSDVRGLDSAVESGDRAAAEREWLTGHTEYETLGAAYGAFGDADTAINGMAASSHTALDDPDLTGFHKIEALLYSGSPLTAVVPYTKQLVSDVAALEADFPDARVDPLDVGLRAHEILENALQFELTGATDAGSHSSLATVDANLTGTLEALKPLRGILKTRYPMTKTDAWIARSRTLVESYRSADGTWAPLDSLDRAQREKLDATVSETVELLANVAAVCDVRRSA
jgi:iron uptake system component EfeO